MRVICGDPGGLVRVENLDAIGLAMLHAAGKLAFGLSASAEVALLGEHGEVRELPFVLPLLPWADLVELDAVLLGRQVVLDLACQLAGMAAGTPLVIQEKCLSCHGYSPSFTG